MCLKDVVIVECMFVLKKGWQACHEQLANYCMLSDGAYEFHDSITVAFAEIEEFDS